MRASRSNKPFAKRSLGQNFLVDSTVIERIVQAFAPNERDVVVEIGPGRGALTGEIVNLVERLYAVEFDRDLAALLRERFAEHDNFTLVEDDALKIDFSSLVDGDQKLRLIANLPYNISTAILQRLFEQKALFSDCVLMFQREVVDRITAATGTGDRGYLSVLSQTHFTIARLFDVPPNAFRPAPKVWSSVVRLVPRYDFDFDPTDLERVVSQGFRQRRKTLLNNLKGFFNDAESVLEGAEIDPGRRAETLSVDEWIRLSSAVTR